MRIEDDRHVAVELVLQLARDGASYELPVAIIASKLSGSFGQIRVYRSTWPIDGSHAYRAPIRWPSTELAEPPVVRAYFEGLARGDRDRVLQTFTQDGYVREPSGSSFIHSGPKGRAAFYEAVFGRPGGVPLVHVNSVWAGRVYAVEYICAAWGPARFPPMPGCAFYELTENGAAIRGVRIYDDVTPPSE
ncbi:MAG: nuclear transport factor 2 family protein [Sphingomicrobium sp.]